MLLFAECLMQLTPTICARTHHNMTVTIPFAFLLLPPYDVNDRPCG